ncbi:MAG: hypothetical protein M3361_14875, partial [Candidatus Tectomicrobia bacterium]|nr:hypothetical protein [Candidatus Tectomicrobia bacterium]
LRPVAAIAGDFVCRVGQALVIDGADFGPVYDAWRGSLLPSAIAAETCARGAGRTRVSRHRRPTQPR